MCLTTAEELITGKHKTENKIKNNKKQSKTKTIIQGKRTIIFI
jgi:hypothetical protein